MKIDGLQKFGGYEVTVVETNQKLNQRLVLVKEVAQIHNTLLRRVNELINDNKHRFNNLDLIDVKGDKQIEKTLVDNGIYSKQSVSNSKSIYLLSERGYIKLVSMMANDNEKKWEVMDKFVEEYFAMKRYLEDSKNALLLKLFSDDPMEVVNAHKKLVQIEVAEATKELNKVIEVQKPKVEYYEKVLNAESKLTTTFIAKELDVTARSLNATLKVLKIIYPQGNKWYLYKDYMNKGYATTKTILVENGDKVEHMICWTEKGRKFIHETFKRIRS